uniref:Protein kinase domain-containing protein n=1 Tax=Globisporangium ultimum (strain ATCC 200006 / CBS 805.95 / DAOM BR144) TaxID=431595 RepID=K3W8P1_GLOUD
MSPEIHSRLTYIKLEQIGSGGSSKVYRMLGPDLKIYALKKIKLKRLDAKSIEQYTNEIQLLERLQGNPHIIRLIAAEQDLQQRQINVVMEHGEIDLSERLRDIKDSLDENFLRVIWTQMLQAVHAIHSERIIHGDLKPANFLFVNGALKLIDFGIAKAISNDTTNIERDSQVGTVNYMSPEAIQGNAASNGQRNPSGKMKVGRASDIWSLGCILYQIVYGKPPFADVNSIIEKFRCIIDPSYPIPYPSLKNKELENVIRSCLQRDHRARPTIDGPGGLLNHPFLRSGGVNAMVSSDAAAVTLSNAPQVLSQLADLLRQQGVDNSRVSTFLSIGQQGLRSAGETQASSSRYRYNTEERRTEI